MIKPHLERIYKILKSCREIRRDGSAALGILRFCILFFHLLILNIFLIVFDLLSFIYLIFILFCFILSGSERTLIKSRYVQCCCRSCGYPKTNLTTSTGVD